MIVTKIILKQKMNKEKLTTSKLAELVKGKLIGSESVVIESVNSLRAAKENELAFLSSDKYIHELQKSRAGAVLVLQELEGCNCPQIVVDNVDESLITVLEYYAPEKNVKPGKHPMSWVSESAELGENVSIGAFAVVEDGVCIGDNTVIKAGCKVGSNTQIGQNCLLDDNVVIYDNCRVGNNCVIQANSTIGGVGFGYRAVNNMPKLVPHLGGVVLEDFVEIGANSCVDRAKFGNTVIGLGTKIDNLVQIAHNCVIGRCCLIAGQVGMAGSTVIGDGVVIGGQAGIGDHKKIGNGAKLGAKCGVVGDVSPGSQLWGVPAYDVKEYMKNHLLVRKLPELMKTIKDLTEKVEKLEASKDNS